MTNNTSTIIAVSSAPGQSMRGLIRLSGPESLAMVRKLGVTLNEPRQLTRTHLDFDGRKLPCLALGFHGPASYTGQDIVEIQVPGNPALLDQIVHRLIAQGARMAEAGEFTFTAYLAGKLDLTQAEGISATIHATSQAQLQAAKLLRQGNLGSFSHRLVESLATALALVEAGIDFTDQDDVVAITPAQLVERLTDIHKQLTDLLANARSWGALEAMPRVVLVGPPSAGKSTLFNALLGKQRAVTHEQAGTTRDILAEPMLLSRADGSQVEVMLMDIAGLDDAANALDQDIQLAARKSIEQADVIVHLGKCEAASEIIRVRPKMDMPNMHEAAEDDILPISAKTGMGLPRLKRAILAKLGDRGVSIAAEKLALQPRHELALKQATESIDDALRYVQPQADQHALDDLELIAGMLRFALDQLASLGGEMTPDDIIGRVFATFCVGK
jgi:tRNA modification GTPase